MAKIDTQMMEIYQKCASSSHEERRKISEQEAKMLIRRADDINNTPSSSWSHDTRRGNKYLLRLISEHGKDFSTESKNLIQNYFRNGHIPDDRAISASTLSDSSSSSSSSNPSPSHFHEGNRPAIEISPGSFPSSGSVPIDLHDAVPAIPNAPATEHHTRSERNRDVGSDRNVDRGRNADRNRNVRPERDRPRVGDDRNVGGNTSVVDHPRTPSTIPSRPVAPTRGVEGTVGPHGTCILDFKSQKDTWRCHWFPMQETRPGGDTTNNLYAIGGPLDKLDKITNGHARQYEFEHNRKAIDEGREYSWWGHCNNASEAACLLKEPKKNVVMEGADGSSVLFTPNDIQGLLVKVTPCLIDRVDFKGTRFNDIHDNPEDPAPALFISVLKDWAEEGIPFVLDIDRAKQVWNFPYDQVKIYESDSPPTESTVPAGDNIKFYHMELSGTGFNDKQRVYKAYIKKDNNGNVLESHWLKTPHNNPDFMWRPHMRENMDITNRAAWTMRGNPRPSNPHVDPQIVYDIYFKSLE